MLMSTFQVLMMVCISILFFYINVFNWNFEIIGTFDLLKYKGSECYIVFDDLKIVPQMTI
jgi:hypothetical protein